MSQIKVGGALCFWTAAKECNRNVLIGAMRSAGLETWGPGERSLKSCLSDALNEVVPCTDKNYRHKVVSSGGSLHVVRIPAAKEQLQEGDQYGTVIVTASIEETPGGYVEVTVSSITHDAGLKYTLENAVERARNLISAQAIGKMLVGYVEHLNASCLRQNGGIYWIHESYIDSWNAMANCVSAAKAGTVYCMSVVADEEMVRAVCDSVVLEITSETSVITADLGNDTTSQELDRRMRRASKLQTKLKFYEEAIGRALPAMQKCIQETGTALALCMMQKSAEA